MDRGNIEVNIALGFPPQKEDIRSEDGGPRHPGLVRVLSLLPSNGHVCRCFQSP